MKTLQHHTLIYDNECPMCNLYSKSFTKFGLLEVDGREAFTEIDERTFTLIDFDRAKNEIALVNYQDRQVFYGLDSLLLILGNSFPLLEKIVRLNPIYWFFSKLYSFISYNRKVIFPTASQLKEGACIPTFNLKYRVLYILFTFISTIGLLGLFTTQIPKLNSDLQPALFLGMMLIVWQTVFLKFYLKENYWEYLGNLMTTLFLGSLMLIPTLIFNIQISILLYYAATVLIMIALEHFRRCSILKIGTLPTISFVTFTITYGTVFYYIISKI